MFTKRSLGVPMDWDELLYEFQIQGLDFEMLVQIAPILLFRGPMGAMMRMGDSVLFRPEWIIFHREGIQPHVLDEGDGLNSPLVPLCDSTPHRRENGGVVIMVGDTPSFMLHAPGDNITAADAFGGSAQA